MSIRQELEMINKKMESTNIRKYNQTANTDRNASTNPNTNPNTNLSNNTPNNGFSNNYGLNNNYQYNQLNQQNQQNQPSYLNQPTSGLTFSKGNQLPVYQRNKGLATQSMIVSNQPSQGFKSQSIFDKYDSLKKPTF